MKRGQALLIAIVVCVSGLAPVRAYAAGVGWWDWLEQLSGPGPFARGFMLGQRVACLVPNSTSSREIAGTKAGWVPVTEKDEARKYSCLTNADSVLGYVEVRGGRITSARKELFSDVPGELVGTVAAHSLQGYLMRQLDPSFAIGAGAGWMWFSGDNLNATPRRFVFTPISVAFMPLKLLGTKSARGGFIVLRAEQVAIVGGMKATDFNSTSKSRFQARSDVVGSVSVTFDVFALLNK